MVVGHLKSNQTNNNSRSKTCFAALYSLTKCIVMLLMLLPNFADAPPPPVTLETFQCPKYWSNFHFKKKDILASVAAAPGWK